MLLPCPWPWQSCSLCIVAALWISPPIPKPLRNINPPQSLEEGRSQFIPEGCHPRYAESRSKRSKNGGYQRRTFCCLHLHDSCLAFLMSVLQVTLLFLCPFCIAASLRANKSETAHISQNLQHTAAFETSASPRRNDGHRLMFDQFRFCSQTSMFSMAQHPVTETLLAKASTSYRSALQRYFP